MRCVDYLFLRLYGANLERRTRSRPDQACADAIAQFVLVLVVPCAAVVSLLITFLDHVTLEALRDLVRWIILGVAVLLGILTWPLRRYRNTPSVAAAFRGKASRVLTWILFFLIPVLGIGLFLLALRVAT